MKNKKALITIGIIFASLVFAGMFFNRGNTYVLKTSVLDYETPVQEKVFSAPDLSIEKISLKKLANPVEEFNYYKYDATLIIRNDMADIRDARVILSAGDTQIHKTIRNTDTGFSIDNGDQYIVRNYPVLVDGDFNGTTIDFELSLSGEIEADQSNNQFRASVFEKNPGIQNFQVLKVEEGKVKFGFESRNFRNKGAKFELLVAKGVENLSFDYQELEQRGEISAYLKTVVDETQLDYFKPVRSLKGNLVEMDLDPEAIFLVRAIDEENNRYALSEAISVLDNSPFNRSEFAKLFVEGVDIYPFDRKQQYFEDVPLDKWFAKYIATMYDLGLLRGEASYIYPEKIVSRLEALTTVLDYYDADLSLRKSATGFKDVSQAHPDFAYINALKVVNGESFGQNFHPDAPATRGFLTYLINAYSKGN